MAHIPHRRQLVERLKQYPFDHAQFLELTRQEHAIYETIPLRIPTDSVASARIDGMPQGRVALASDPTQRIVLSRETIQERLAARQSCLDEKIRMLADRLEQFWDWWSGPSTDVARAFIRWRWWDRSSYQQVARYFLAEGDQFHGYIPDTEKKVLRYEDELLEMFERLWYEAATGAAEE